MTIPSWSKKLIDKCFYLYLSQSYSFIREKCTNIIFDVHLLRYGSVCLSVSNATSAFAVYVVAHNTMQLVKNLLHYDNIFVVKKLFFWYLYS